MAIIFYKKKYTETLSLMLKRFRIEYPEFQDSKITYAGRLDPMAEGLMILLTDEDVHKKQEYLNKSKVYIVDFFFGAETDTLDILGMVDARSFSSDEISKDTLISKIKSLETISYMKYPAYSSKTVNGKPLWVHARDKTLHTINIPEKKVIIYSTQYLSKKEVRSEVLFNQIISNIHCVEGDFRQTEIIDSWRKYFDSSEHKRMNVYSMRLEVSSGTYVRKLVSQLAKKLKTEGVCLKITRLKIGDSTLM